MTGKHVSTPNMTQSPSIIEVDVSPMQAAHPIPIEGLMNLCPENSSFHLPKYGETDSYHPKRFRFDTLNQLPRFNSNQLYNN